MPKTAYLTVIRKYGFVVIYWKYRKVVFSSCRLLFCDYFWLCQLDLRRSLECNVLYSSFKIEATPFLNVRKSKLSIHCTKHIHVQTFFHSTFCFEHSSFRFFVHLSLSWIRNHYDSMSDHLSLIPCFQKHISFFTVIYQKFSTLNIRIISVEFAVFLLRVSLDELSEFDFIGGVLSLYMTCHSIYIDDERGSISLSPQSIYLCCPLYARIMVEQLSFWVFIGCIKCKYYIDLLYLSCVIIIAHFGWQKAIKFYIAYDTC